MLKTLVRTSVAALAVASIAFTTLPASADGMGDVFGNTMVNGANTAIRNAMDRQKLEKKKKEDALKQQQLSSQNVVEPGTLAQAPPISQQPIGPEQQLGLPTGLTWTADLSVAYPFGNIGNLGKQWLPGGGDVSVGYGFNPTTRIVASLYQLQHWPVGFNTGIHPIYLTGFRNPVGCADFSGGSANGCTPENVNIATKDTFVVAMGEQLFVAGPIFGRPIPFVVSPIYVARTSQIGASGNNTDVVPFAYNSPDGPTFYNLKTRTTQVMSFGITVPFLKSPNMFGTFTLSPAWLVHPSGVNGTNSAQLYQVLYLEYTPNNSKTTIFFEPQSSRDYMPTDPYAEHLIAYFAGVSQRITPWSFVQLVLNSGGPTNMGSYGIQAATCPTVVQVLHNDCAISTGGLKATQLQLQFGFGSPSVIPL
jgi:hypothetical protein